MPLSTGRRVSLAGDAMGGEDVATTELLRTAPRIVFPTALRMVLPSTPRMWSSLASLNVKRPAALAATVAIMPVIVRARTLVQNVAARPPALTRTPNFLERREVSLSLKGENSSLGRSSASFACKGCSLHLGSSVNAR